MQRGKLPSGAYACVDIGIILKETRALIKHIEVDSR